MKPIALCRCSSLYQRAKAVIQRLAASKSAQGLTGNCGRYFSVARQQRPELFLEHQQGCSLGQRAILAQQVSLQQLILALQLRSTAFDSRESALTLPTGLQKPARHWIS